MGKHDKDRKASRKSSRRTKRDSMTSKTSLKFDDDSISDAGDAGKGHDAEERGALSKVDPDEDEDAVSRLEKGLLDKSGERRQRIMAHTGFCLHVLYDMKAILDSLFDITAWRSLGRLVFAFRSTQYQDVVLSLVSLVITSTLGSQYERKTVQLPVVSLAVAVLSLPVPFAGISASFRLRQTTIQAVVLYALVAKIVYSALLLWYLHRAVAADLEVVFPETVLAILRIILGFFIIIFGILSSNKISEMKRLRKTVLLIGLDGHGKSLLVDTSLPLSMSRAGRFGTRTSDQWEVNPTAGLSMHEFRKFDSFWRVWDMSGNGRGRELWPFYYGSVDAIFFVIDSTDLERLAVVKHEFFRMTEHPDVRRKAPILIVVLNKTDLSDSTKLKKDIKSKNPEDPQYISHDMSKISPSQIRQLLKFDTLSQHYKLHVQVASALQGFGMDEALQWLANTLSLRP